MSRGRDQDVSSPVKQLHSNLSVQSPTKNTGTPTADPVTPSKRKAAADDTEIHEDTESPRKRRIYNTQSHSRDVPEPSEDDDPPELYSPVRDLIAKLPGGRR